MADGAPASEELLCTVLATESLGRDLPHEEFNALWQRACAHDVDVLIAAVLLRFERRIPATARQPVADRLAEAQLRDLLRYRELCRVAASLAAESVDVLVLKGAGLAYTVYSEPHLRPSRDVDLFIRREARDAAERALATCGYTRMREPDGEFARAQYHYARSDGQGLNHFVDLHWRVSDSRVFGDALSFDDAWASSIPLPAVEPTARTLGYSEALLLACIHRVAHHHDAPDLLWLWDIHLLATRLTVEEWETFVGRAERAEMRAVSARGLELARDRFGTPLAAGVLERLTTAGPVERTARFLGGNLRLLDVVRADLAATRSWGNRARLVREHLFPSREYMRAVYSRCPAILLPIAYLHRLIRGSPKWFRRPPSAGSSFGSPF